VDEAADARRAQPLAQRRRLRAPERAELEAVEMPIKHVVRILHIRVSDQEEPAQVRCA